MDRFSLMDQMEQALFDRHFLPALTFLTEQGRELEFEVGGHSCFLSRYESAGAVSLWVDGTEQAFSSMAELLAHAKIGTNDFADVWSSARFITLF